MVPLTCCVRHGRQQRCVARGTTTSSSSASSLVPRATAPSCLLPESARVMVVSVICSGLLLLPVVLFSVSVVGFTQESSSDDDLRSAVAMSQLVLAQQAQFFRELINATRDRSSCCPRGKSDLSSSNCPYPFSLVVEECFYMSPNALSWHSAQHSCRGMGGNLATPKYLYALKAFITDERGPRSVWIGGADQGLDGGWRWVNGDVVDAADWANKQPSSDRPVEHCLSLRRDRHPVLDDSACHVSQKFVCQYHFNDYY